jgi:hypothetical protein
VLRCENQQVRLDVRMRAFGKRVRRRIRICDRDFDSPPDALKRWLCLPQNHRIDGGEDCHDDEEFFRHELTPHEVGCGLGCKRAGTIP